MKIRRSVLARFVELPAGARALRELLDDVGIEVKRLDEADGDVHLTLELLANRGDHYAYEGIAREIGGRTGVSLTLPPVADLEVGGAPHPVLIESEGCLVYTLTALERSGTATVSLAHAALTVLEAAGLASVSPAVDATNVANLELGQPTHAFDADTIEGPVCVRDSLPGERAWPLFEEGPVELPEGTLVIADDVKILAIAGVIGCEESKTTEATERLLLESATFDPVRVRLASRALGLHTDSSARFERGADPSKPLIGAGRVVQLLEDTGAWRRVGASVAVGDWTDPEPIVPLSIPAAAGFLEHPLTATEVRERLERYGFTVSPPYGEWSSDEGWSIPEALDDWSRDRLRTTVLVRIPPHRQWDVSLTADLYEELARSIGYNATPERLPPIAIGAAPSPGEVRRDRVDEVLTGLGFYEVFTDGFHGRELIDKLGFGEDHPLFRHVETQNALDRGYSLLKNNALGQAVEAVATNLNVRVSEVKAFEWTRTFHPDPTAPNRVCRERPVLWAIASGHDVEPSWAGAERPADVWFMKGLLEELGVGLGHALVLDPDTTVPLSDALHPTRRAVVRLGGEPVGVLGEVHPAVLKRMKIKRARPVYLELDAEALLAPGTPVAYVEPDSTQPMERSLAFDLPPGVPASAVAEALWSDAPRDLTSVQIVDRFDHDEAGVAWRAITYALAFEQERSADDLNGVVGRLADAVLARLTDRGVQQR